MPEETYTIKETLAHYFSEINSKITDVQTDLKSDLVDIKTQTTKTNGRVTSLESSRDRLWGSGAVLTILGGTIIALSIMAIDTKIQRAINTALDERVSQIEYEK